MYRELFHLSAEDMEREPADKFFINMRIHALIKEKEKHMEKHGTS